MLDDACHFLGSRGLLAAHYTTDKPPRLTVGDYQYTASNGDLPYLCDSMEGAPPNQNWIGHHPGHTQNPDGPFNGNLNGGFEDKKLSKHSNNNCPKILVWTAADEDGINRLAATWQEFFSEVESLNIAEEASYLEKLAFTLDVCRSSLTWKSFAVIDTVNSLTQISNLLSRPSRSSKGLNLGYVFTGQGAAYNGMGRALLAYPVFKGSLERFDTELALLGCEWSVLGK